MPSYLLHPPPRQAYNPAHRAEDDMNTPLSQQDQWLAQLDSFHSRQRQEALNALLARPTSPQAPSEPRVNMHLHSFFSFNTHGYSPSHLAWQAHQAALYAAGLCDFDVLDGLEEFLQAGLLLGLRTSVSLETRAFLKDFASLEINSPGEPGVIYIMGAGFPRLPSDTIRAGTVSLEALGRQARERLQSLVQRINARLPQIALDYEKELAILAPGGCPTERHLVQAYRRKTLTKFQTEAEQHAFWAQLLKKTLPEVARWAANIPQLEDAIRTALVKRGGLGYLPPTPQTFPPSEAFISWVLASDALPMIAWLDGTSAGESDPPALFECLRAQGALALNIIPDRNHNIAQADQRALQLKKLAAVIDLAERLQMPINIGTEMNKAGQPFADDIGCEALRPYQHIFLRGARILVGQSILARYAGFAYAGRAARAEFGTDLRRQNDFFEGVGGLPPLTKPRADHLASLNPTQAFSLLQDSVRRQAWAL